MSTGDATLPHMPWEERPAGSQAVVWRCSRNPIIPRAALHDAATGRLAIYYGAADTVTALAFAHLDEVITFIKENCLP